MSGIDRRLALESLTLASHRRSMLEMDGKAWQWVADISDELGYQLGGFEGQRWLEYNTFLLEGGTVIILDSAWSTWCT